MRVLIIGGTELISTAITRALIMRGDDVTLYNRGQTEADIPEGYEPEIYSEIIERWRHISVKGTFFGGINGART